MGVLLRWSVRVGSVLPPTHLPPLHEQLHRLPLRRPVSLQAQRNLRTRSTAEHRLDLVDGLPANGQPVHAHDAVARADAWRRQQQRKNAPLPLTPTRRAPASYAYPSSADSTSTEGLPVGSLSSAPIVIPIPP
eukprot:scaffold22821_cov80-Isochrysis_galbana.AAC.1